MPPQNPQEFADQIVAGSGSNLARTLFLVPRERRHAMRMFYAFCRIVDDAADDLSMPAEKRRETLLLHRRSLRAPQRGESPVAAPLRDIMASFGARIEDAEALVDGMLMDLEPVRYPDFPALETYCQHAASAVGLVSLRILGCCDDSCDAFARRLGVGLQLVNILRDVGEDYTERGRIYLPGDAMTEFGCDESTLQAAASAPCDLPPKPLLELMRSESGRARGCLNGAERLIPSCCAKFLKAPLLMRAVYSRLLDKMERDGFRVFSKRYRLGRWEKLALLGRVLLLGR